MTTHTQRPLLSMRRAWLPLLATLLVAGCGTAAESSVRASAARSEPAASSSPAGSEAPSAAASESAAAPEPAVFAEGVISTAAEEWRISFTPDGETAYFARSDGFFPQTRDATIMETTFADGSWSDPVVASFSGEFPDIDPWVSPDGESVYFSSIRPVNGEPRRDVELFRVDREGDGWGEPVHLADLGSEGDELGLSVADDGSVIFASERSGGGNWDLFSAEPDGDGFANPEPIEELNSPIWEFNPAVDASGSLLIFTSINRSGGVGLGDLWVTKRDGHAWSEPRPLPTNTSADEYHASLSPDGTTLYFVRRTDQGDLFEIDWAAVDPNG